jgi:nucleoid-associated protein YgaU
MSKSALDADAGVIWQASPKVSFAYSRINMLGADLGLAQSAPVTGVDTIAIGYREEDFICDIEDQQNIAENRALIGIEKLLIHKLLALRLGLGWGDNDYRQVSAGFGINMKQFSIDYAFEYPISGIDGTSGTHYLTVCTRFNTGKKQQPPVPAAIIAPKQPAPAPVAAAVPEPVIKPAPPAPVAPQVAVTSAPVSTPQEPPVVSLDLRASSKLQLMNMLQQFCVATSTPVITPAVVASSAAAADIAPKAAQKKIEPVAEKPSPVKKAEPVVRLRPTVNNVPGKYTAIHRVIYGDTLPSLAEKYYNDKSRWLEIYEANSDKIEKGSLQADQILIIP